MISQTLRTLDELSRLEHLWHDAHGPFSKPAYPFLDFYWLMAYAKYFCQDNRLCIEFSQEKDDFMLLPMVNNNRPFKSMNLLGDGFFDYRDVVVHGSVRDPFLKYFKNVSADILHFNRLREDSIVWSIVKTSREEDFGNFKTVIKKSIRSPYISIKGDWEEYLSTLKRKFITDIQRQIRRLLSLGDFQFRVCQNIGEVRIVTETLFNQHIERRKVLGQDRSIFEQKITRDFLNTLNEKLFHTSKLRFFYFMLNKKIIAVAECFLYGHVLYYYLPTFSDGYKAYSPGNTLLYYIIKFCFENEVKEIDFLGGEEEYKLNWNAQIRQLYDIYFYKKNLGGYMACAQMEWMSLVHFLKDHLSKTPLKDIKRRIFIRLST